MINQTSISSTIEKPLVILKRSRKKFMFGLVTLVIITMYCLFGIILPVLLTGDYNAMWLASDKRVGRNITLFYLSLLCLLLLPVFVPSFKAGNIIFYNDRMEIKPFLGMKKKIIPYKKMHISFYMDGRMTITLQSIPSWVHPIRRYYIQYWDGLSIVLSSRCLDNYADVPRALQILKENAFEFVEKQTITIF